MTRGEDRLTILCHLNSPQHDMNESREWSGHQHWLTDLLAPSSSRIRGSKRKIHVHSRTLKIQPTRLAPRSTDGPDPCGTLYTGAETCTRGTGRRGTVNSEDALPVTFRAISLRAGGVKKA